MTDEIKIVPREFELGIDLVLTVSLDGYHGVAIRH